MRKDAIWSILLSIRDAVIIGILIIISCAALSGCGHNVYMESETMGMKIMVPVGDGSLGIMIGSSKTVSATVRGGASFETTTSAGGGLFSGSGGQNKISQFKSNLQVNEGNLVKIMTNPEVPQEAKVELAKAVVPAATAPYFPGYVMQTRDATIHLGKAAIQSNNVEKLNPTGLDHAITEVSGVVNNTVTEVSGTVSSTVHDVANPLQGTVGSVKGTVTEVKDTITTATDSIKAIVYLIGIILAVILLCVFVALVTGKKKKTCRCINANPDDQVLPPTKPGELLDEDQLLQEMKDAEKQPASQEEVKASLKKHDANKEKGFARRLFETIGSILKTLHGLVLMIPPPMRSKIVAYAVDWWKKYQAKREAAKKKVAK